MRDEITNTLQTLGLLYESAFGVERWPAILDAIAELIGGNGALLFVNDSARSELQIAAMSQRYKADDTERYLRSLMSTEELRWVRVLDEIPPRTLCTDIDIWPDRTGYDGMPSVRFMRALNLYHRVAVRPCVHGGWKDALTVLFDDRRAGITPLEAHRLELLVPHIARAIELQRPFKLLQKRFGAVLSVLDRLGIGVLILEEEGACVAANTEAERILDAGDGLVRAANAQIAAVDAAVAPRFSAALQRATRAARLELRGDWPLRLQLRRAAGDPLLLEIAPFRDDGGELGSAFVGTLLVLIDPEHRDMVAIDSLVDTYDLTPTETLVCRLLAQGMTLREIADVRSVSLDTVKTQSRAIYGKTRTRNRSELVRRALSILPPLLDRAGRRIN